MSSRLRTMRFLAVAGDVWPHALIYDYYLDGMPRDIPEEIYKGFIKTSSCTKKMLHVHEIIFNMCMIYFDRTTTNYLSMRPYVVSRSIWIWFLKEPRYSYLALINATWLEIRWHHSTKWQYATISESVIRSIKVLTSRVDKCKQQLFSWMHMEYREWGQNMVVFLPACLHNLIVKNKILYFW